MTHPSNGLNSIYAIDMGSTIVLFRSINRIFHRKILMIQNIESQLNPNHYTYPPPV